MTKFATPTTFSNSVRSTTTRLNALGRVLRTLIALYVVGDYKEAGGIFYTLPARRRVRPE